MVSSVKNFELLHYFNTSVEHSHFSLSFLPRTMPHSAIIFYLQDIHVTLCHENTVPVGMLCPGGDMVQGVLCAGVWCLAIVCTKKI